jgi:hypothetical protein
MHRCSSTRCAHHKLQWANRSLPEPHGDVPPPLNAVQIEVALDRDEAGASSGEEASIALAMPEVDLAELLQTEVERRRNFAIISHPDAGKTTLVREPLG